MAGTSAGPFDPAGLSTVHEVTHQRPSYDTDHHRSLYGARPSGSHEPSISSSFALGHNERDMAAEPPPVPYAKGPHKAQHVRRISDGKLKKSDRRNTTGTQLSEDQALAQQPKRGGIRGTIRRIFGRKSAKDRMTVPSGTVYQPHNPEEFITSAATIEPTARKVERSASLPTNAFIRSSGLSSHPPFQPPALPAQPHTEATAPVQRDVPEPPRRPDRASVPSISFTKEDLQAVTDAMSGIGLPTGPERDVDARNIGFAVTNGSNPKRRSRSVGATGEGDHRMSPIQWRQTRTKSDDLAYYKEVAGRHETREIGEPVGRQDGVTAEIETPSQDGNFDFELQAGGLQDHERIGPEERLVTLEIKLMDLEYTLSKLQARSATVSQRTSEPSHNRQRSIETYNSVGALSMLTPASSRPSQAVTPAPSIRQPVQDAMLPRTDRPTSVATTLRPVQNPQANPLSQPTAEVDKRFSLSALTIEHYTTLVTLIRHEQSARMRLEEQVQQLQQKLENFPTSNHISRHPFGSASSHGRDLSSSSHISHRFGSMHDDGRRRGKYLEPRPRSSSYSTNETDTEDDYHDAYVSPTNITPVERGEYERGAFNRIPGVEDGEAF